RSGLENKNFDAKTQGRKEAQRKEILSIASPLFSLLCALASLRFILLLSVLMLMASTSRTQVAAQELRQQHCAPLRRHDFPRQYAGQELDVVLVGRSHAHLTHVKYLQAIVAQESLVADEHELSVARRLQCLSRHGHGPRLVAQQDAPGAEHLVFEFA